MLRLIHLLLLLVTTRLSAAEPDPLASIRAQIEQHAVVRAEFTQTKQMAALKRPLLTFGHLVYSRRHGVLWEIEQPYRMSYVLGETRIVEIAADGTRLERDQRDVPGLMQVGRVFRALIGANTATLGEAFELRVQGDSAGWEIELKPRQAQLAQFLSGLRLSGGRFVEGIRINESSGDSTQIRFRNMQGASRLTDAELRQFGGETADR